jgi:hypothetical protein
MMCLARLHLWAGILSVAFVLPAAAQDSPGEIPLDTFVDRVAGLWAGADVEALVGLISESEPLLLDAGSGTQSANSRHAAAALRALFAENETVAVRTVRVTMASASPIRGFGELTWTFRTRGTPIDQSRSLYVAALREDGSWHITELRLMP